MTLLSTLKAEIADDLARSDLTTRIAAAINAAIDHYQEERFFFNETRAATFATVAAQSRYTSSDDADIPLFLELDDFFIEDSTNSYDLGEPSDPAELEFLLGQAPGSARPFMYARLDDGFILYPPPDIVYTVRPIGHIEVAAPATDSEADNPWMTKAYQLIRCRAEGYLYRHVIKSPQKADIAAASEASALQALRGKTSRKRATGRIKPTLF